MVSASPAETPPYSPDGGRAIQRVRLGEEGLVPRWS